MNNKYLEVRLRPWEKGNTVCRIYVGNTVTKKVVEKWDQLDNEYPLHTYTSRFVATPNKLICFKEAPVSISSKNRIK